MLLFELPRVITFRKYSNNDCAIAARGFYVKIIPIEYPNLFVHFSHDKNLSPFADRAKRKSLI